ncbi:MAG: uracil-DNA glycosylase [Pseudomonadota bacterium]
MAQVPSHRFAQDAAALIEEAKRSLALMKRAGAAGFDLAPGSVEILKSWEQPIFVPATPDRESLAEIRTDLGECVRCKLSRSRTHVVFGAGDPAARLVFVGEGPGAEEDRQGLPFVGAAGDLLTKMIVAMKLTRETVYICNIVKCRPPENRNPEPDEIGTCIPFLKRQLRAIRPDVIVTLGGIAAHSLLDTTTAISRLRGQIHEWEGVPVMPTFHPAFLLRTPAHKREVWEDMKQVMQRLGISL